MDGVRAYWNGLQLLSRQENTILCPAWFTSTLPKDITLDGELWMGKGTTHENVMKILKTKNSDWRQIGYYVFDVPSFIGTYEERMEAMESLKPILPSHIHIVKNVKCRGTEHLQEHLHSVVASEGEGVMLRKPHSLYEHGYTSTLLKAKVCPYFLAS